MRGLVPRERLGERLNKLLGERLSLIGSRGPEFFVVVRYRSFLVADLSNEAHMSYFFKRDKKGMTFIMQYYYIV